jgi:hypothetical protein
MLDGWVSMGCGVQRAVEQAGGGEVKQAGSSRVEQARRARRAGERQRFICTRPVMGLQSVPVCETLEGFLSL